MAPSGPTRTWPLTNLGEADASRSKVNSIDERIGYHRVEPRRVVHTGKEPFIRHVALWDTCRAKVASTDRA